MKIYFLEKKFIFSFQIRQIRKFHRLIFHNLSTLDSTIQAKALIFYKEICFYVNMRDFIYVLKCSDVKFT